MFGSARADVCMCTRPSSLPVLGKLPIVVIFLFFIFRLPICVRAHDLGMIGAPRVAAVCSARGGLHPTFKPHPPRRWRDVAEEEGTETS